MKHPATLSHLSSSSWASSWILLNFAYNVWDWTLRGLLFIVFNLPCISVQDSAISLIHTTIHPDPALDQPNLSSLLSCAYLEQIWALRRFVVGCFVLLCKDVEHLNLYIGNVSLAMATKAAGLIRALCNTLYAHTIYLSSNSWANQFLHFATPAATHWSAVSYDVEVFWT